MRVACKCLCLVLASSFAIILTGCNLSQFGEPSRASSVLPAISGKVHGGQQPISGAAIYLYAANTTVSKGASAALLGSPVLTNASGGFSIGAGAYTCPTPGTLVYLVATGGNPGLPGTVNNTAIGLMVLLGTCSSLSTDAFVTVNELTTVAAVEALAPFMADAAHVGSDVGNPGGLAGAFATAASMVNFATGQIQTAAAGVTQPVALLNTLADILAACVNSAGRGSTPCGVLRGYAGLGGAPDTLTAMLLIVRYPSQNVAQLFGLVGASAPFMPELTLIPSSFVAISSVALASGSHGDDKVLADSQSHIWVLQPVAATLSEFDSNLNLLHTFTAGTPVQYPLQMALDPNDNLWVVPPSGGLFEFGSDGSLKSPTTGYTLSQTVATNTSLQFTTDSAGNVWFVVERKSDLAWCLLEYSGSGVVISPPAGYCGSQRYGISDPTSIIADTSGNVYLYFFRSGTNTVSTVAYEKFTPSGSISDVPASSSLGSLLGAGTMIFDPKFQHFWGDATLLYEGQIVNFNPDGSVNFFISSSYPSAFYEGLGGFLAVDGAGSLWVETGNYGALAELGADGTIITGCTGPISPIDPRHICGIPTYLSLHDIAIDPTGNIFSIDDYNGVLIKVSGLAAAK